MKRAIIIDADEWDRLPVRLAEKLCDHASKRYGFRVIDKETGQEIADRFRDWMVGTVVMAWMDVTRDDDPRPSEKGSSPR